MKPGISFVVRVRNEEKVLEQSLHSLQYLTFPHEIIVVLHLCTDRSAEIAASFSGIRIYQFDIPLSRAGFETLITPAASSHSLISYYDWCFAKAAHLWCFKWDADHIATPELIDFLNSRTWDDPTPTRIRIPAVIDGFPPQLEPFLFNGGREYAKYIFWEYNKSIFAPGVREEVIAPRIIHASPADDEHIKPYWRAEPWFQSGETPEAVELDRKYKFIVERFGPEPLGLGRAVNPGGPICGEYERALRSREAELNSEGIHLWY